MPTPASYPAALDRRLKRAIAWVTVVALIALAALRGYDLWERRQFELQQGERRAANLALMLAAYLREAFAAADTTLRQLTIYNRQVGGPGAPAEKWSPMLGVSRTLRNGLGSISVTDADGIIRHSTVPSIVGNSRRENYIFRRLSAMQRDMLVADTPFRAVTDPRLMLLPLGRRLTTAADEFQGVVVATFTPAHLRDFFGQVDIGRTGHIWVFHPEGTVLFHVPSPSDPIGESASGNPLFERARALSAPQTFRLAAHAQTPASLVALQPVGEPRLFVAVTLGEEELLTLWRHEVVINAVVIAAVALAFAAMLRFMFRQVDARGVTEQALGRAQRLEAIGQLTGGVAHDFNNLLTVIMMNVSVLKLPGGPGAPGSRHDEQIRQIEDAAKRAATLTQRLLTFARRQPLQPKLVDLNQVVRDLQPMLVRLLGEDITIKPRLAPDPCTAKVDPVQLETALLNLSVNARDALPQGGLLRLETARVTLRDEDIPPDSDASAGDYAQLSVIDNGHGIAPEHLSRVFEPFFSTKPFGQGTGLGLSMVYGFVKQSGGHVKIHSERDRGTTVTLYFPFASGEPAAPEKPLASSEPRGQGELIFVLEDEAVVRQVAEMMLHKLGYKVVSAKDGPEALARARELPHIDLFLTDVVLPGGMNGREVAQQLTRERPGLRVLYASGYSLDVLQQRSQMEPELRLIPKPYDLAQLAQAVHAALTDQPHPTFEPPRSA